MRVSWHFPLQRHLQNSLFLELTYAQAQMDYLQGKLFIFERPQPRHDHPHVHGSAHTPVGVGGGSREVGKERVEETEEAREGKEGKEKEEEEGRREEEKREGPLAGKRPISEELMRKAAWLVCWQIVAQDEKNDLWVPLCRLGKEKSTLSL